MMKKIANAACYALCILLLATCNNKTDKKGSASIITGENIEIASERIPVTGGKIIVNDPKSPLKGLTIEVPANAFTDERNFKISAAKVKSYDCGPDFNPLTPLISISNGGGYSTEVMTLSIPVHVPAGQFAMAFIYDEETGSFEGMPLLASDSNKVVVMTSNFSSPISKSKKNKNLAAGITGALDETDKEVEKIIITSASEQDLKGDYDSGFRPGVDDCPFTNWGSSYAPNGQCSGQSLAMLWYYTEKKLKGEPALYQLLDNDGVRPTPGFWQDDANGIKLASIMQYDFSITAPIRAVMVGIQLLGQSLLPDKITMNAFRYALKLTHQPQFINISILSTSPVAHAMLVYKIEGNSLFVADPNYPGKTDRRIIYNEVYDKFLAYNSGPNAGALGMMFTSIFYMAKSSMLSWPTASTHWQELENKTIGQGKFSDYTIVALNAEDQFVPLTDGFKVPGTGNLTLNIRSAGVTSSYLIYDVNGKLLGSEGSTTQLQNGEQRIGINVIDKGGHWMGFQWVTVIAEGVEAPPSTALSGKLTLNMSIDGATVDIDSATFDYDGALSLRGWSPHIAEGVYAFSHYIKVHVRDCKGLGNYQLDDGGEGTYLWQYHSYPLDRNSQATMSITHWASDNFDGVFSFVAIDPQGNKKTVTGDFHYQKQDN